jgi:hypothetical protein
MFHEHVLHVFKHNKTNTCTSMDYTHDLITSTHNTHMLQNVTMSCFKQRCTWNDDAYGNVMPWPCSTDANMQGKHLGCYIPNINKCIWKLRTPLKIKIFLWYSRWGAILTKDNLAKRNWQGTKTCCFCYKEETIRHLFSIVSLPGLFG